MAPQIKTERLVLRPYLEADREPLADILGRWEVACWLSRVPHPFGPDDVHLTAEDGSSRWPDTMAITCADHLIGAVSTQDHVGYFLHPDHWGQGIATEAARAAVQHAFETTDVASLASGVFHGNDASFRVLDKLGFEKTSENHHFCRARGQDMPHSDLTLTRKRWEGRV